MQAGELFTISEIAKKTGSLVRSVNKEIGKLVETGAVLEEVREVEINKKLVKVKHYQANVNFLLFNEIRDLLFKAQTADFYALGNKLQNTGKIKYAVLCGKFVGDPEPYVDLLIIGRANRDKLDRIIKSIEKILGEEVNYAIMDTKEFDYRQKIGDMFLFNILSGKKIEVVNEL